MNHFPEKTKFKFPWRNYQQRVLDELETHISDEHLHIIAPPGSGKTVLGLEVALRINQPTLIFAPTIAIRNQWINRFCELFLDEIKAPQWISTSLKNPQFLTVVTYQSLHSLKVQAHNDHKELPLQLWEQLVNYGFKTIVVDEAHHLKNAWWTALNDLKESIRPQIVGLTATPPYDVTYAEWNRYLSLNGPVDTEISVPELIKEKNLCPHQDHVFLSLPTLKERERIYQFRDRVNTFQRELLNDSQLQLAVTSHYIFNHPEHHIDWIYEHIKIYSAILIYANASGLVVDDKHLDIIGDKNFTIPVLTLEWLEVLLTYYLFNTKDVYFNFYEHHKSELIKQLKRIGAVEHRSINLIYNRKINQQLTSSISKLDSIHQIVTAAYRELEADLRMVILTDYIRKEYLISQKENNLKLDKIGVVSIFESLRRSHDRSSKKAVLTGSIIILPSASLKRLDELVFLNGLDLVSRESLTYDNDYALLKPNDTNRSHLVNLVTQLFEEGAVEIIIGTKSLLGEGWDAPAINSLVLASFVGSFVSSNQMRGRAIRVQQNNPNKTSNIWHLACVDPSSDNGGSDIDLLKRRFKTYVGICNTGEPRITNGIQRIGIPKFNSDEPIEPQIASYNKSSITIASRREELLQRWEKAITKGVKLTEEIKIPFQSDSNYKSVKSVYYQRTIKYLTAMTMTAVMGFGIESIIQLLKSLVTIRTVKEVVIFIGYTLITAAIVFGGLAWRTFSTYIKFRDISKDVENIAHAIVNGLINAGAITTPKNELFVISDIESDGSIFCRMDGGTNFEKSIFVNALQECIDLVDNPKYIIVRKSKLLGVVSQQDYHSVPDLIGRRKEFAQFYQEKWQELVGDCELIFTRNIEGRKLLLKARIHSLAASLSEQTERINEWK